MWKVEADDGHVLAFSTRRENEEGKASNRSTCTETLKMLLAMGFRIKPKVRPVVGVPRRVSKIARKSHENRTKIARKPPSRRSRRRRCARFFNRSRAYSYPYYEEYAY